MREAWRPTAREKNRDVTGSSCMLLKDEKIDEDPIKQGEST